MGALVLVLLCAGFDLSGSVIDDQARPVAGAEVRLASAMRGAVAAGGNGIYPSELATTDAAGLFSFRGVVQKVAVEAHAKGHMMSRTEFVELPLKRPLVLRVDRLARATGRVTLDGKPYPDAYIDEGGQQVDARGAFEVFVWRSRLVISGEEIARKWLDVKAAPGAMNLLGAIALERGVLLEVVTGLEGHVFLAEAAHLRARERLGRSAPEQWRQASFSADDEVVDVEVRGGVARFPHVPRGEYVLWGAERFPPTAVTVKDRAVRLELRPVAPAVLEITDRATARRPNDYEREVLALDCEGRFVRVPLEAGTTTARVAPGKCRLPTPFRTFDQGQRAIELKAGETARVTLVDGR